MAVRLVCFASYLTRVETKWRPADHDASKFIKAIKGNKEVNGYANVPVGKNIMRLEKSNRHDAYQWFGKMAGAYLDRQWSASSPDIIPVVPLPSSEGVVGANFTRFPARDMANALCRASSAILFVADILRWRTAKPAASSGGGSRDYQELRENLVITKQPPFGPFIVVDDVCTTGAHLRAAVSVLEAAFQSQALFAVCAGRATREPVNDPWAIHEESIEVEPQDPFWPF